MSSVLSTCSFYETVYIAPSPFPGFKVVCSDPNLIVLLEINIIFQVRKYVHNLADMTPLLFLQSHALKLTVPSPDGNHSYAFVISWCLKGIDLSNDQHSVIIYSDCSNPIRLSFSRGAQKKMLGGMTDSVTIHYRCIFLHHTMEVHGDWGCHFAWLTSSFVPVEGSSVGAGVQVNNANWIMLNLSRLIFINVTIICIVLYCSAI